MLVGQLLAVDFERMRADDVRLSLDAAPRYSGGKFNWAMIRVIRAIHSLSSLHQDEALVHQADFEVYIGRAGCTDAHVQNRWRAHKSRKQHRAGIVLFQGDTEMVVRWERDANRLLSVLKGRNRLCVKDVNIAPDGRGNKPRPGTSSVVYMTWRPQPLLARLANVPLRALGLARKALEHEEVPDFVEDAFAEIDSLQWQGAKRVGAAIARPASEVLSLAWTDR